MFLSQRRAAKRRDYLAHLAADAVGRAKCASTDHTILWRELVDCPGVDCSVSRGFRFLRRSGGVVVLRVRQIRLPKTRPHIAQPPPRV